VPLLSWAQQKKVIGEFRPASRMAQYKGFNGNIAADTASSILGGADIIPCTTFGMKF
jgi:hypothetical protein